LRIGKSGLVISPSEFDPKSLDWTETEEEEEEESFAT
jgi:hypothetical protein